MRVLILNQYALPKGDAGITRHGDIGAELTRRGHTVTVVASDFGHVVRRRSDRADRSGPTRHAGVDFLWMRTGAYVANDRRRIVSMIRYALLALWTSLRIRPRPDIIVGSSPHPLTALAALVAARLRNIPWVFEVRDLWPSALVDMEAIHRDGFVHQILGRLERRLYQVADAVVSVPPRGSVRLQELGIAARERHYHIPNGVAAVPGETASLRHSLDRLVQRPNQEFVLAYTGTVGVMQDFGNVISAIRVLRDTDPDAYDRLVVLIVGGGVAAEPSEQAAKALALDRLYFHPAVPKPEVRSLLRKVDACLVSLAKADVFRYGLSPNKLFDYFAAAKPVLISAAHPTLVDEVRAGIRYEPGDPLALAQSIARMVKLPSAERRAMGDRGRRLIESDYSISAITDRYEAMMTEVQERYVRGAS